METIGEAVCLIAEVVPIPEEFLIVFWALVVAVRDPAVVVGEIKVVDVTVGAAESAVIVDKIALMFVKHVVALGEVFPVVGAVLDFIVISAMIIIGATAVIVGDILVVIAEVAVVVGAEVVDFLKL